MNKENVILWFMWVLGLFVTFKFCNIDLFSYSIGAVYNGLAIAIMNSKRGEK